MTASSATFGGTRRSAASEFVSAVVTIMVKELRSRMRGRRAFVVLTLYLGVLALITYGAYVVVSPVARQAAGVEGGFGFGQANASALVGQSIFSVLSIFQVILVSMIAPAFTAGQISLEREKQTLDLLITTPLRPGAIIIGKLVTSLAFVILMILAAIPICAIVLMYGGATVEDIVRQQVVLLAVAIGFGAIGMFASALMRRTQAATVLTYCVVLTFTLGSAMLFTLWTQIVRSDDSGFVVSQETAPEQLRYVNPLVGMLDIVSAVEVSGPTPFTRSLYELFGADLASGSRDGVCNEFECPGAVPDRPVGDGDVAAFGEPTANYWWPRVAITFLLVGAVLTVLSMRLVVPVGMRDVFRRRPQARGVDPSGATIIEELPEAES